MPTLSETSFPIQQSSLYGLNAGDTLSGVLQPYGSGYQRVLTLPDGRKVYVVPIGTNIFAPTSYSNYNPDTGFTDEGTITPSPETINFNVGGGAAQVYGAYPGQSYIDMGAAPGMLDYLTALDQQNWQNRGFRVSDKPFAEILAQPSADEGLFSQFQGLGVLGAGLGISGLVGGTSLLGEVLNSLGGGATAGGEFVGIPTDVFSGAGGGVGNLSSIYDAAGEFAGTGGGDAGMSIYDAAGEFAGTGGGDAGMRNYDLTRMINSSNRTRSRLFPTELADVFSGTGGGDAGMSIYDAAGEFAGSGGDTTIGNEGDWGVTGSETGTGASGADTTIGNEGDWQVTGNETTTGALGGDTVTTAANESTAAGRVMKWLMTSGAATPSWSDLLSVGGSLGSIILGLVASGQQAASMDDLRNQILGKLNEFQSFGAPYRSKLADLYTPEGINAWINSPEVQTPIQQGTDMAARALSAQIGNPALSGTGWSALTDYATNQAWNRLGAERDRLGGFGGLTAYNQAAALSPSSMLNLGLAGSQSDANMWHVLGAGLADLTQPKSSLENLWRSIGKKMGIV